MLRTAFGAFEALLGRTAVQANAAKGAAGRRIWTARASIRTPAMSWQQGALMSQLRAARSTVARTKPGQLRTKSQFIRARRPFHSSRPRRADATSATAKAAGEEWLSLSARLKKLSREYGWTSVGVYFALSVLDFPFCFLLVRTVGTERIGKQGYSVCLVAPLMDDLFPLPAHIEHVVVSNVQKVIPERVQDWWMEYRRALKEAKMERTGQDGEPAMMYHGVEEAEQRSKQEGASKYHNIPASAMSVAES
jgi:hypothetical protein